MSTVTLSRRDRALLVAAAEGRCEMVPSGVPDLRVDGRWFCDQPRAHALVAAGLLARASTERGGTKARARLTAAGRAALTATPPGCRTTRARTNRTSPTHNPPTSPDGVHGAR